MPIKDHLYILTSATRHLDNGQVSSNLISQDVNGVRCMEGEVEGGYHSGNQLFVSVCVLCVCDRSCMYKCYKIIYSMRLHEPH